MKLLDIVHRESSPQPWAEGDKIPWNDPAFSRRMLNEHLSQNHDAASRRFGIIDGHIRWIHDEVLDGEPTHILDLGCGPGFYLNRLAERGHRCVGIDFSPASIAYAKHQAEKASLECKYIQQDIRTADYGRGYGLVMLIYGEVNVFRPQEAKSILAKACQALESNGYLVLEPHTFEAVLKIGKQPSSWYAARQGLFSDNPHFCLQENFWDAESKVAIERYYIIEADTGEVARHSASVQAYTDDEYRTLLANCGFGNVAFYPVLAGSEDGSSRDLMWILAKKTAA